MTDIVRDDAGFLRLDPIPTAEEVDRYYAEEFYARKDTAYVNDSSLENMREEAEYHRRAYEDLLDLIESWARASRREPAALTVADVGCGYGHWLRFLGEHGLSGYGVEPVEEGVEYCRSEGIDAYCLPIEDLEKPPENRTVDVVSMVNVLEHLRDPAGILRDLHDHWIRPGGTILLRVPNEFNPLQVTADERHGLGQWWIAAPRHINYFDHRSLATLLDSCGFDVIESTSTFPLEIFLLMGDVYVGDPGLGKQCHRKRVEFERTLDDAGRAGTRRDLYRAMASVGVGREVIVLAQRR